MGRPLRATPGELVYHVLNRANGRKQLFVNDSDYATFEDIMAEACQRISMRLLAYCVMPNHWHLVVWPKLDGDLSRFVGWLSLTHAQRWHAHRQSTGSGHVYQGRFKSFMVQTDAHLLSVCRYVERNALRAKLVERAEEWRWCSLWRRQLGNPVQDDFLSDWPVAVPDDWLISVNSPETKTELSAVRRSAARGQPFGAKIWVNQLAEQWKLVSTLRSRGRPRNEKGS